jgi:WD40 repeat protein/tRNA A-37 threonylcarbamoyl transferase component Bud32
MSRDKLLAEIIAAYLEAVDNGQAPDRHELLERHPELALELKEFFADHDQFRRVMSPFRGAVPPTQLFGSSSIGKPNHQEFAGHRFGEYELIEEIARGGMGVVFKARNARLDRTVAIKMILAGHLATPDEVERFRREARSAAQLDHPNIVPLYEVGEHDGQHYFAMKLISGGSLADELTRFADNPRAAVELLKTVARAVHYAHQRGILHRDLKPANILIERTGQPHVTDFGLAKRLVGESEYPSSSAIVGTPSYMAPEQVSGNKALSTAIDVYSLGAIFYELLTGRSPFRAVTPFDTLLQVVQKDPEPPSVINPRVDRDLDTICLKCLAKDPEGRYGSAEALADDFERWLAGEPIQARRSGTFERIFKWARRRKSVAAVAVLSALATVAFVVALAYQNLEIKARKLETEKALMKHKEALREQQIALGIAKQTSYYQTIALAAPEVTASNVRRADQLLDTCPADLRRWEWGALKQLCHGAAESIPVAMEPAGVVFSPDGRLMAAAGGALGEPGFVSIWDAASSQQICTFRGHDDAITALAFNPAGDRLATASRDRTVRIWNTADGRPVLTLRGHSRSVWCVGFSPEGRLVASAGADEAIKLWDAASGAELRSFAGHSGGVWALAFEPEGRSVVSSGADRTIKLWDTGTVAEIRTLHGHTGIVRGVAFSPDGRMVASAGYDGTARIWNAANGRELVVFRGHSRFVTSVAFSPDGRYAASSSVDRTVKVWEAGSGQTVLTLRGHDAAVWCVAFRPKDWRIASAGEDRMIKVWNAPGLAITTAIRAGSEPVSRSQLSALGRRLAVLRGQFTLEVWSLSDVRRICSIPVGNHPVEKFALSPDGNLIAAFVPGFSSAVRVWAVDGAAERQSLEQSNMPIAGIAFSPQGGKLALADQDGGIRIWDTPNGRAMSVREKPSAKDGDSPSAVTGLLYNPGGTHLVVAVRGASDPEGNSVLCFDTASAKERFTIPGVTGPLRYSPDGRSLLAVDSENGSARARVFDCDRGRELTSLRGHIASIRELAFSPDGARIASSSSDGTIKIWESSSGRELLTLPDNDRPAECLRFTGDGSQLIAVDDEGTVRIWGTVLSQTSMTSNP